MRVTVPQPAHHAHFCCFQAVPGMLNYAIISNRRFIKMRFYGKFAYNYFLCHYFDLVCNFLTFNLYAQSWNLDYCFAEVYFQIFDWYVLFNGRYICANGMYPEFIKSNESLIFIIIVNNKYYYYHSYFTVFKMSLKWQNIHISRFWTWPTDDDHIGLSLINDLEILLLKLFNDRKWNEHLFCITFTRFTEIWKQIWSTFSVTILAI